MSPEVAFVSAATTLDLVNLVAAGDWLVRLERALPSTLIRAADEATGRGCVQARRAARLVRERVDSVQETRLRLLLVLAGLPEPECNISLGTEHYCIGRVDLVYQRWRVILEYEGDQHFTDRDQWNSDIGRYEEFTGEGWTVIRVTKQRMRYRRLLVTRTYEALRASGYEGPPPTFSPEWLSLFERL